MPSDFKRLEKWASLEVEGIIRTLPAELREKAAALPVTLETFPDEDRGVQPDTLGLFVGPELAEDDLLPLPPQIILFLENIWDLAEGDERVFREEVRRTYLHELGHYLGLDEQDLWDRGLD